MFRTAEGGGKIEDNHTGQSRPGRRRRRGDLGFSVVNVHVSSEAVRR